MRFSWLPIFSIPRKFWKALIQIVYLLLGLQHFESSNLDPMLYSMCSTVHTNELCPIMLSQYYSRSMCSTLLLNLLRTFAGYLQLIPINTPISANLNNQKNCLLAMPNFSGSHPLHVNTGFVYKLQFWHPSTVFCV